MVANTLEEKIDSLIKQFALLSGEVKIQNQRLIELEKRWNDKYAWKEPDDAIEFQEERKQVIRTESRNTDRQSFWVGSGSFLSKVATGCFILVFALILRTLTDSGIVDTKLGCYIGTAYAVLLFIAGWWMNRKKRLNGALFTTCGALLMYALILETRIRFETYTATTSYALLALTMLFLVITGKHYKTLVCYGVGIIGATCIALVIDFPNPFFPKLALFLVAVNVAAGVFKRPRSDWMQGALYALTILFWYSWAFKLHAPLVKGMQPVENVALTWFIPVTLLIITALVSLSVYNSFKKGHELTSLDLVIPTIHVFWFYPACILVLTPWQGNNQWLGYAGLIMAAAHFIVAGSIFKYSRSGGPGICAYVFAGACLMVMATLSSVENILPVLPFWGVVAILLTLASQACEIGGIRLTSYLLQCVATLFIIFMGGMRPETQEFGSVLLVVTGSLAAMSAFQYYWSRHHPVNCSIGFFARLDPKDHSAVVLLIAALLNGFFTIKLIVDELIITNLSAPGNALLGMQSTIINISAIGLLIFGLLQRNREILYTAIGVVIIGGVKTLGYDLFKVQGLPLVFSVFSFGAVAAVGSVVFNKWQHRGNSQTGEYVASRSDV